MLDGENSITHLTKSVFPESNMVESEGIADVFSHCSFSSVHLLNDHGHTAGTGLSRFNPKSIAR
jgi:hypothetical protein